MIKSTFVSILRHNGILCLLFLFFAQRVLADSPDSSRSAYKYILDYDVPESPAFTVLGVSPAKVLRGSAAKPIVLNLLNQFGSSERTQNGVAVDFSPFFVFGGRMKNVMEYRNSRKKQIIANTLFSFSTVQDKAETTSLKFGVGLRLTLFDCHDLLQNAQLGRDIDSLLLKSIPKIQQPTLVYFIFDSVLINNLAYKIRKHKLLRTHISGNFDEYSRGIDNLFCRSIENYPEDSMPDSTMSDFLQSKAYQDEKKSYLGSHPGLQDKDLDSLLVQSTREILKKEEPPKPKPLDLSPAYKAARDSMLQKRGPSMAVGIGLAGIMHGSIFNVDSTELLTQQLWISYKYSLGSVGDILSSYQGKFSVRRHPDHRLGIAYRKNWLTDNWALETVYTSSAKKIEVGGNAEFKLVAGVSAIVSVSSDYSSRSLPVLKMQTALRWNLSERP